MAKKKIQDKLKNAGETILPHLDKLDKIPDLILKGGIAIAGFNALRNPLGAVYGLLAYKLATNEAASATIPNVSRVAGLMMLGHIGLSQSKPPPPTICPEGFVKDIHGNCVKLPYVPPIGGGR